MSSCLRNEGRGGWSCVRRRQKQKHKRVDAPDLSEGIRSRGVRSYFAHSLTGAKHSCSGQSHRLTSPFHAHFSAPSRYTRVSSI